jgi:hypothetical protein
MVAENVWFEPPLVKLRELVADGAIGPVSFAHIARDVRRGARWSTVNTVLAAVGGMVAHAVAAGTGRHGAASSWAGRCAANSPAAAGACG